MEWDLTTRFWLYQADFHATTNDAMSRGSKDSLMTKQDLNDPAKTTFG